MKQPSNETAHRAIDAANQRKGNDGQAHALIAIAEAVTYIGDVLLFNNANVQTVSITEEFEPELDWPKALERIERLIKQSKQVALNNPYVNNSFYELQLRLFQGRYDDGERTKWLYDAIMNFAE